MAEPSALLPPAGVAASIVGTAVERPPRGTGGEERNDSSAAVGGEASPVVQEVCAVSAPTGGASDDGDAARDTPAGSGDREDAHGPLATPAEAAPKQLRRSWSAPADAFGVSAADAATLMQSKKRRPSWTARRLPVLAQAHALAQTSLRIGARSTHRTNSTKERHDLYASQLAARPLLPDVVQSIRRLHAVKTRFALRRVAEDLMFVLMLLGIALMIATNEVTQANRTALYDAGECEWGACDPRDCWYTIVLKALTTLSTLVLIGVMTWRYSIESALLVLRGYAARKKLDCLCRRPTLRFHYMLEIVLCAFHIPPGVDFSFGAVSTARGNDTAASRVVHVNTLGVIMFVRLYQLMRIARNHNGVYSPRAHWLGSLHGVNVNNARYALKYLFGKKPIMVVCIFAMLTTVVTTIVLTIVERPGASETGVNNYGDALWLSLITMSTVGCVRRTFARRALRPRRGSAQRAHCARTSSAHSPPLSLARRGAGTAISSRRRGAVASQSSSAECSAAR